MAGQADIGQQFSDTRILVPTPGEIEADVLRHGQPGKEAWLLEDEPDVVADAVHGLTI
jgi:hypothetical protein